MLSFFVEFESTHVKIDHGFFNSFCIKSVSFGKNYLHKTLEHFLIFCSVILKHTLAKQTAFECTRQKAGLKNLIMSFFPVNAELACYLYSINYMNKDKNKEKFQFFVNFTKKIKNNDFSVLGQFRDGHFPIGHFHERLFPEGEFPVDISPTDISPKDSSPNGHLFPRRRVPQITFPRTDISPNEHFPERTILRTDNSPNGQFPESHFLVI